MQAATRSLFTSLRAVSGIGLAPARGFAAAAGTEYRAATFRSHGNIDNNLKVEVHKIPELEAGQVQVKMLAAPITRADVAEVQGTLPTSKGQPLPSVAGNEGVGEVEKVASGVSGVKVGDWVVPRRAGLGTWRSYAVTDADNWIVIPKNAVPAENASVVAGSAVTALRLLSDYANLSEGDTVIQSGANGLVGTFVAQFAHLKGVKTINVIPDGVPAADETTERLKNWGAYVVVGDQYARDARFKDLLSDLPAPSLAINGTGGEAATEISRHLAPGSTMVSYDASASPAVTVPTSQLLFNDIQLRGFWLTRWQEAHSDKEYSEAINQILPLVAQDDVKMWLETRKFSHFWNDGWAGFTDPTSPRTQILMLQQ